MTEGTFAYRKIKIVCVICLFSDARGSLPCAGTFDRRGWRMSVANISVSWQREEVCTNQIGSRNAFVCHGEPRDSRVTGAEGIMSACSRHLWADIL